MKVVWTTEARECLAMIQDYIAADNPDRALRFVLGLLERVESQLSSYPWSGRIAQGTRRRDISELIVENYRVAYRVLDDRVDILSVAEGHTLPKGWWLEGESG